MTTITRREVRSPARETLWSNADFVKLWLGESVSLLSSEVTLLALPLTAVPSLHASAASIGLLNAARFAPFLLLSLPAGVWVDRLRRRPVLVSANIGSALVLASVPALADLGMLGVGYLSAAAFLSGACAVLLHVAFWSYVPSLVEGEALVGANSKLFASSSAAAVAGPGVAGILVQTLGLRPTLTVAAVGIALAPVWIVCSPIGPLRTGAEAVVEPCITTASVRSGP